MTKVLIFFVTTMSECSNRCHNKHIFLIFNICLMASINDNFKEFLGNLQYTQKQREDAKTKYEGVCKSIAKHFLGVEYEEHMKFLFGSYKTKTHIRPIDEMQDVDVIFMIDEDIYLHYKDNPSQLLQAIRKAIQKTYSTTEKISAWAKVVLVKFSDNAHNVEVLPGYEQEDGTFLIPNTENGGSWETFDPREQIDRFVESNGNTKNLTRELVQMIKSWVRNHSTLIYKSFHIVDDVIKFNNRIYPDGKEDVEYIRIVLDYLNWLSNNLPEYLINYSSQIETAKQNIQKAMNYEAKGNLCDASEKLRDVFGDLFPKNDTNSNDDNSGILITRNPPRPWCRI